MFNFFNLLEIKKMVNTKKTSVLLRVTCFYLIKENWGMEGV